VKQEAQLRGGTARRAMSVEILSAAVAIIVVVSSAVDELTKIIVKNKNKKLSLASLCCRNHRFKTANINIKSASYISTDASDHIYVSYWPVINVKNEDSIVL